MVCALVQGGGYAEYCTAPTEPCLPIPEGLTPLEAALAARDFFYRLDKHFRPRATGAG